MIRTLRGSNSVAEWQLPKLHTRVRFPSPAPFLLAAVAFLCGACSGLPPDFDPITNRLHLIPVQPALADMDPVWAHVPETDVGPLKVLAANSVQDLHLRFSTDDPGLQQQLVGQYGQSLLLLFAGPEGERGLRIDFKPKASFSLGVEPLDTVDQVVTLLGPSAEGYPRRWHQGDDGIELSSEMLYGALVYEVRLPLQSAPGRYGLDVKPGDAVVLTLETTYLDRKLADDSQVRDPGALEEGFFGRDPYGSPLAPWGLQGYDPGDDEAANGTFVARIRYRLAKPGV